jgi:hypothetical protein
MNAFCAGEPLGMVPANHLNQWQPPAAIGPGRRDGALGARERLEKSLDFTTLLATVIQRRWQKASFGPLGCQLVVNIKVR